MAVVKQKSFSSRRYENLLALIAEVKVRKKLTEPQLAKLLGIGNSTLGQRKANPGTFRFDEICMLIQLADKTEDVDRNGIL